MNIEIVSFTGDSGLADYTVSLARALSRTAHTTVVTARSLPARFDSLGFAVERVFRRTRHYPWDIFRFFWGVLRRRPDWVLVQGPLKFAFLDALVIRALALFRINMAVTVHDVLPHYPKFWSRVEYGFYYRSFKRVVAHSEAAQIEIRALRVNAQILVVPHGIYDIFDLTGIAQKDARNQIEKIASTDFVVLFFGHLEPRKGLLTFLDAAELMQSNSNIKFVLAGSNSLVGHSAEFTARLDSARAMPNVVVHDRRIEFEKVEVYFSACDVVALPYLEGTTSGVLKLALAFKKPVVATRVGDFPEQVPPGGGLFIESNSNTATALREALETVRANLFKFSQAVTAAGEDAQWPAIAERVKHHLR